LAPFREGLQRGTYAIMQPELRVCAGPLTMRKIGAMCDAWNVPIAPHAATGLALAGRLQVSAAMGSLIQEIGVLEPGSFPWDVWDAYRPILHGETPFTFRDGAVVVPQHPGLVLLSTRRRSRNTALPDLSGAATRDFARAERRRAARRPPGPAMEAVTAADLPMVLLIKYERLNGAETRRTAQNARGAAARPTTLTM
jgi:hypothetical protein